MNRKTCIVALMVGLATISPVLSQTITSAPPLYVVQSIGLLPNGKRSAALSLNNMGRAVGVARDAANKPIAVYWEFDARKEPQDWLTPIYPGADGESYAYSLNDVGQAVGKYADSGESQAFLWQKGQTIRFLGTLSPNKGSVARSINNMGLIVGYSGDGTKRRAFVYDSNAAKPELVPLGVPDKNFWCQAFSISNSGLIVGEADPFDQTIPMVRGLSEADGHDPERLSDPKHPVSASALSVRAPHGFVWTPGRAHASDRIRASIDREMGDGTYVSMGHIGGGYTGGLAVNDFGKTAGISRNKRNETRAVLFDGNRIVELGTMGGQESVAWGINNASSIVGWARNNRGEARAFLWIPDAKGGTMHDLNDLLTSSARAYWTLTEARDINERGQICGRGFYRDPITNEVTEQGFVLTRLR